MATASTVEREIGHTGAWFNYLWAPLGAAAGGEETAASYFRRARWYFDLARRWDGGFDYDCLGEGPNSGAQYNDFRMSTAALLTYALPLRKLHLTGRGHDPARDLTATDVAEAEFADGYDATLRGTTISSPTSATGRPPSSASPPSNSPPARSIPPCSRKSPVSPPIPAASHGSARASRWARSATAPPRTPAPPPWRGCSPIPRTTSATWPPKPCATCRTPRK